MCVCVGGGGGGGPELPRESQLAIEFFLKILVQISLKKQLDPRCFSREIRTGLCEIR